MVPNHSNHETHMNDQVFQLLMSKMDTLHNDLRQVQVRLEEHIEVNERRYSEVRFIKRAFQVTWAVIGAILTWLGIRAVH